MHKLPAFSGYCPPGQLRSMSRRLACAAVVAARARHPWPAPQEQTAAVAQAAAMQRLAQLDRRAARAQRLVLIGLFLLLGLASWVKLVLPAPPPAAEPLPYYAFGPASLPFHCADEPPCQP